jgi:hypothetical protein
MPEPELALAVDSGELGVTNMHMFIGVITYGVSKKDGRADALDILNQLVPDPFDYYNESDTYKATSVKGANLIKAGMEATWRDFQASMRNIREIISTMSDEDIFEEHMTESNPVKPAHAIPELARYYFHQAGEYRGSNIWLYDKDGEGIRDRKHLANVLSKWECNYKGKPEKNPFADLGIWITMSDVHH